MALARWRRNAAAVLLAAGVISGVPAVDSARAGAFRWADVAEEAIGHLDTLVAAYRAGKPDDARDALIAAYFGSFEDRKMEAAMRKEIGVMHTGEVEGQFSLLRRGIGQGMPAERIAAIAAGLSAALRADAKTLDAAGISENVYDKR